MLKNKNMKKFVFTILKVVIIILFTTIFMNFVKKQNKAIEVVGFARNMEEGVKVTKDDIKVMETSPKTFTSGMIKYSEAANYIGKYTTTKVFSNTLAYKPNFDDMGMSGGFAELDLTNSRVISLPIDMIESFAGEVKRGDTVDLMFKGTGTVEDKVGESSSNFTYTKIFMQDIPVYQVNSSSGHKFIPRAHSLPGEKYVTEEDADEYENIAVEDIASISLVVTPEQAEQIEARRLTGNIKFVKRFPESETHETLGFVIGSYGKIFSGNANAETTNMNIVNNFKDEADVEEKEEVDEKDKNSKKEDMIEIK